MRIVFTLSAASLLASLAACAPATQPANAPVVSTDPRGAQGMPQPPNSLPSGAAVNAPVTRGVGEVSTTGVGGGPSTTGGAMPAPRRY